MKKVVMLFVVAFVVMALGATAMAQTGTGSTDILGNGIFETEDGVFSMAGDTNSDQVVVGNDVAVSSGLFSGIFAHRAYATNNLEIKKNQDTGVCACCPNECKDCCLKSNLETITVGNRLAVASGMGTATNNVKIVTNQA